MKDIVVYGCGGMGREIVWLIEEINNANEEWNIIGYIDDNPENSNKKFYKYAVIGDLNWLKNNKGYNCVLAIGNGKTRKLIADRIKDLCTFPTLIHPSVSLNESIKIDKGCMISANVIFTTDISIGKHVFINVNSNIMHDVEIQDFSTIFLGVNIAGGVKVKSCTEIGSGSTLIPYSTVGENTIVGAGSVVTRDIPANCTAVGSPAKPIKFHE
jgi:sugar O-acyltransferase (sialic acid O-acetyltransferase NeuD family)